MGLQQLDNLVPGLDNYHDSLSDISVYFLKTTVLQKFSERFFKVSMAPVFLFYFVFLDQMVVYGHKTKPIGLIGSNVLKN